MDTGGDLKTTQRRYRGGDLRTTNRQHGGIFGLLKTLLGFGASPAEIEKAMRDPIQQQMLMQRGGFPWAMAALSMLPMLLGKGDDVMINQMKGRKPNPQMIRGGLSIPPGLVSKALPLLKNAAIPLAFGALSNLGTKAVDAMFGDGIVNGNEAHPNSDIRIEHRGGAKRSARKTTKTTKKAAPRKTTKKVSRKTTKRTTKKATPRKTNTSLTKQIQDMVLDAAKQTGKRALGKATTKAKRMVKDRVKALPLPSTIQPVVSRFYDKVDDSISQALRAATSTSTPSSAHIGQSINI